MNNFFKIFAVLLFMTSVSQSYDLEGAGLSINEPNDFASVLAPRPIRPPIRRPIRPICTVDPTVQRIDFRILYKTAQFRGRIRITAEIKNIGGFRYSSNANQQTVLLYEGTNLVASRNFQNLDVGQAVLVSYDRSWDASSPSEGEFPPEYKAVIVYDPDIYLDGNSMNDDCNSINNQLVRSGSGINALF